VPCCLHRNYVVPGQACARRLQGPLAGKYYLPLVAALNYAILGLLFDETGCAILSPIAVCVMQLCQGCGLIAGWWLPLVARELCGSGLCQLCQILCRQRVQYTTVDRVITSDVSPCTTWRVRGFWSPRHVPECVSFFKC
jgi:hypothetical protein